MATKPKSTLTFAAADQDGRVAWRSVQGHALSGGGNGFPAGLVGDCASCLQRLQQPPALVNGAVVEAASPSASAALPSWAANKQHHPSGNTKSRLHAVTSDRTTPFLM